MPKTTAYDPDPYVIAGLAIDAGALITSLISVYIGLGQRKPARLNDNQHLVLTQLEAGAARSTEQFTSIERLLERGLADVDKEFYDAPIRVAQTQMMLSGAATVTYGQQLSQLHSAVGILAQWLHHVIGQEPDLAARLGERLSVPLSDVAAQLNSAMESGEPIRTALVECKLSLRELGNAIEAEFTSSRSN